MAMIEPVLGLVAAAIIMVGEQIVQPQLAAHHFGEPAGRNPDMAAAVAASGVKRGPIFAREAREILGVDEMAGEEAALVLEAIHRVGLEAPRSDEHTSEI